MFICGEGHTFRKPKVWTEEHGETVAGCPICESGFDEMKKCKICEIYFEENSNSICYECAEELYTDRLGLKFIEQNKEFYLDFYGVEKVDKDLRDNLIEILEKEFTSKVDMDSDGNKYLEKVKEYVLEDISDWIGFLEKEGEI